MARIDAAAMEPLTPPRTGARARRPGRVALGRAVLVASLSLCVVTVAIDVHARLGHSLAYVAGAVALALCGGLLTARCPEHRIAWLMAATGLWSSFANLIYAYATEALVERPASLPGGTAAAWLDSWGWVPGIVVFPALLLLLMPDGHLPTRRWWPVLAFVAGGAVLLAIGAATSEELEIGAGVANPLAAPDAVVGVSLLAGGLLALAGLGSALAAFLVRYHRARGELRQQLRWVAVAFCTAAVLVAVGASLWGVVPGIELVPALGVLVLPAGVAVAVLRYRLYDLDLVVNRTAVYAVLTVGVVACYVLVVGLVGSYATRRGDLVVALVVTGAVAVGVHPARTRVQRLVNRLMFGERDDPYLALARVGHALGSALRVDAALPGAVEAIGRTLALQHVALVVHGADDGPTREVAAYGTPGPEPLVVPLVHQGEHVGDLLLAARPGERLRERDRRLLADLAPQVAAAVHAVALAEALEAARRRQAALREEERRRIRRDLHDGLGPALAGLTFTIDAARNLSATDRDRADELLAAATDHVQALMSDVRRLIYGLRPPTLDALGLAASLRRLGDREATGGTRVVVEAPDSLPPLDAAVEVATYRIAQEALTNALRHAGAGTCTVRLAVEAGALVLTVRDDGSGLAQPGNGVGLHAMRERAAEVGGACDVACAPGRGTAVTARLPLATAGEAP
jgi:signal transduction histidine kinase